MTSTKTEIAPVALDDQDMRELDVSELELVAGGSYSLSDTIHRFFFGLDCILGGGNLVVKGEQLQCRA